MAPGKTLVKNLALIAGSLLFVIAATLATDRVFGALRQPPGLPETVELIFPPFSEQHYKSHDFEYSVYINSIGIRDRELPKERGNTFRVLAIGDSYTYGWGVNIEDTWMRMLEAQLREAGHDIEILNLGKPGVGPPFYAELAEQAIPLLRPDLILICMLQGNDLRAAGPEAPAPPSQRFWSVVRTLYPNFTLYMRDLRRERIYGERTHHDMPPQVSTAEDNRRWTESTARTFYENMPQEHRARFDAFDDVVKEAYLNGLLNPYMVDLAMQNPDFYVLTMDLEDSWTQTCIERTAALFARIKQSADTYGSRAAVVSIPEGPYVNRAALQNMGRIGYVLPEWLLSTDSMDESLRRAAILADLPFYEVTEEFRAQKENPDLYFELDGHPTQQGNYLFAEAFRPVLEKLIPAP